MGYKINEQGSRCIIVFLKAPKKGFVKTRLAEGIGSAKALMLYQAFVSDILSAAARVDADIRIFGHPRGWEQDAPQWTQNTPHVFTQKGADLGERMVNALACAAADGYWRTVLIGSDIPEMTESLLEEAFCRLADHDAVIGPAMDGGYYLVGFSGSRICRAAFEDMAWSGADVYENTRKRLAQNHNTVYALQPLADIDTVEDLRGLASRLAGQTRPPFHTRQTLAAMQWI